MRALSRKTAVSLWNQSIERVSRPQLWSTGLLILSSAALGGIAVALWNRQVLTKMREADEQSDPGPVKDLTPHQEFE